MTGKNKLLSVLISFVILFVCLQIISYYMNRNDVRSLKSVLNQYYLIKQTNPEGAKRALDIILKSDPGNKIALQETAYWYLQQGAVNEAITAFKIAFEKDPDNIRLGFELGRLYWLTGQYSQASQALNMVVASNTEPYKSQAQQMLMKIVTSPPRPSIPASKVIPRVTLADTLKLNHLFYKICIPLVKKSTLTNAAEPTPQSASTTAAAGAPTTISNRDQMLNKFYDLQKKKSPQAWKVLSRVVEKYPCDYQIIMEAAYYSLMTLKNNELAVKYFCRAYSISKDPKLALQLGYIFSDMKERRTAYHYFDLATQTSDTKDRMTAELAKSSMRGAQTKFLPYPYEATLDYSPLYMSRFKLLIQPIIFRFNVILNELYHWKVYLSYRRSSDNKSNTNNQVSSIFEDNAAITAIGTQFTPIRTFPQMIMFAEWGKANDLVYRNRARWRTDFRGGFAYYDEWGRPIDYTLKPTLQFTPNADIYADAIFYNRYHDSIATARVRPGAKVFRYGAMSVDLYYRMFLIQDTSREFYNNILELGPGVALRPNDRYNIVLRYDQIHGRYLPAGSPSPNPYSKRYFNGVTQLDMYFEF